MDIAPENHNFFSYTRQEWEMRLLESSIAPVHAKTMFRAAYKDLEQQPNRHASLPKLIGMSEEACFQWQPLPSVRELKSNYDNSVKFLFELNDGSQIESVLMPEKQRITLCISSQVGCQQGCVFCHTGRMGLKRNLTSAEIVGQIVSADLWIKNHPEWLVEQRLPVSSRITNIVFMGMGEPLDNVEEVVRAIKTMTDPYGLALGLRKISVSTAGHLDGIRALFTQLPDVRLALSVHSPDDAKRSKIMPINRKWPLSEVLAEIRKLGRHPILLQYTMIKGVNDSTAEAQRLVEITRGLNAKVNLIPLNEVGPSRLTAPSAATIQSFRDVLHGAGLRTMVRYSKGQDIAAACGQLVVT